MHPHLEDLLWGSANHTGASCHLDADIIVLGRHLGPTRGTVQGGGCCCWGGCHAAAFCPVKKMTIGGGNSSRLEGLKIVLAQACQLEVRFRQGLLDAKRVWCNAALKFGKENNLCKPIYPRPTFVNDKLLLLKVWHINYSNGIDVDCCFTQNFIRFKLETSRLF